MGRTNLKEALERKFAALSGELKDKRSRITVIEGLFEELPVLSARAERVKHLQGTLQRTTNSVNATLREGWRPGQRE